MSAVDSPTRRKFSREEFYQLAEMGWFGEERVELIDGDIVELGPIGPEHASTLGALADALRRVFGTGFVVREQSPLDLKEIQPQPDVAVVRGTWTDFRSRHPETAELIVEIAASSLGDDRRRKARLYASAGIPEYWILNLKERRIEVYRDPRPGPNGAEYRSILIVLPEDNLSPLAAPDAVLTANDLL